MDTTPQWYGSYIFCFMAARIDGWHTCGPDLMGNFSGCISADNLLYLRHLHLHMHVSSLGYLEDAQTAKFTVNWKLKKSGNKSVSTITKDNK